MLSLLCRTFQKQKLWREIVLQILYFKRCLEHRAFQSSAASLLTHACRCHQGSRFVAAREKENAAATVYAAMHAHDTRHTTHNTQPTPCLVHSGHTLALPLAGLLGLRRCNFFFFGLLPTFWGLLPPCEPLYGCADAARLATTCRWNQFTFGVLVPLRV